MSQRPLDDLNKTILSILQDYCNRYVFFKPTFYSLAKKHINQLRKVEEKADSKNVTILKIGFEVYKSLVESKSEVLATTVGLALARQLNINENDFLHYRESKIWTQHYIQGLGAFECQVYRKDNNKIIPEIEVDPIYNAYVKLNNQIKLSKVITEDKILAQHNQKLRW